MAKIHMNRGEAQRKAKVINITARRREAMDLAKFIDAHGGKLGAGQAAEYVAAAGTRRRIRA